MFTAQDIEGLIAYGESGSVQARERLGEATMIWGRLLCGEEPWLRLAESLDERELRPLIKGIVLLDAARPAIAGSVSPVILLYRRYQERFADAEPSLTSWVVDHRTNPYEPFGTPRFSEARSYEAWLLAHARHEAEVRQRRIEHEAVAAKHRAEQATTQLADAVRRGDATAVEALLAKGADAVAAAAMAGMPLSKLAAKEGRTGVLTLLRERGIP